MAVPTIVTIRDFTSSRYEQLGEDLNLNDILSKAEAVVRAKLRQHITVKDYVEMWRPKTNVYFTKVRPITEVTQVRRRINQRSSWVILDPLYYTVEHDAGYITFEQSVRGYEIEVEYSAGYEVVPEDIKEAIILQAVLLSYQDIEVYGAGDAKQPGILYMQDDIDSKLKPYKQTATVFH